MSRWQIRIVAVAWITYAAYYLGRVNISTAMPEMRADLGFSAGQIGLISTGFFWSYALGQLINGRLGDKLSPRRFVLAGLAGTAAINLIFGAVSLWPILVLLWAVNGYFQATGWGPILRLLANWLEPAQRTRVSGMFGSCFVAGNALTWLLTGWIIESFGWRAAFWMPALLMLGIALIWYASVRDRPEDAGEPAAGETESGERVAGEAVGWRNAFGRGLRAYWSIMAAAAFVGFCFVSLILWMPTYFVQVQGVSSGQAATLSALLPLAGIVGTLLIGWIVGRFLVGRELRGLAGILIVAAVLFQFVPHLSTGLAGMTIALMITGSVVYGASSLTLTTLPLTLAQREHSSSIAGVVGFAFNMGAGLSGGLVGAILDTRTWNVVFVVLAGAALAAALLVLLTPKLTGETK